MKREQALRLARDGLLGSHRDGRVTLPAQAVYALVDATEEAILAQAWRDGVERVRAARETEEGGAR